MSKFKMMKCEVCGRYTLRRVCPVCQSATKSPHPARFSPEDPYGKYRRALKRMTNRRETTNE